MTSQQPQAQQPPHTTLPRRHLADAIATASHGDYIRIALDGAAVQIIGADPTLLVCVAIGDATATATPPAPTSVTVPTRQLIAEVKALPDGDVTMQIIGATLQLRSGNRTATITAQGRLPDVIDVPASSWQPLSCANAATLGHAIAAVAPAAVVDPARPAVAGVRLEAVGGVGDAASAQLHVVATDGARLHCRTVTLATQLPRSLTLPNAVVGAVTSLLGRGEVVAVKPATAKKRGGGAAAGVVTTSPPTFTIAVGVHNIALRCVDTATTTTLYARLAPEPYAPWRRIADGLGGGAAVVAVTLDATALLSWLRSCPADAVTLCVDATAQLLRLDYVVTDDTGTRRLGGGEDSLGCVAPTDAPPLPIKLSVRYLRDVLVGCMGDVVLSWSSGQPVRVSAAGQLVGVVMWMR